ncbi:uncharacterized protein N7459_001492 [Penicillium hispanicum]|uniref:uncharacterized protein n=1 Tax=Penicillium hispanicum TaxID=1080232 RepID=UPI0025404C93|nr:uncharacterized protein N7459_001492 [Penicillium hispanicum]KAJ5595284.1 hypothetical protein N7459_001492 [Penicillium hispanicum]
MAAVPARNDRRIILHLDYDCFYASVFEVEQPALKALPLAVQQKQIVVTCNYEARRRGLHKLQLIKDAKRICPDVVIVLGEDLTKFRDASKDLYLFIRSFVWGGRVERLGFDELSLDVTEMIDYNTALLNPNDLTASFFHLDRKDPTIGFPYNATEFLGSTYPSATVGIDATRDSLPLKMRLLVASHLIGYLRCQMEHEKGFTATGGVSTSKLLAKLVGSVHKPNQQTTLVPPYETTHDGTTSTVTEFMDAHEIRKIPGIGSRLAQKLRLRVRGDSTGEEKVTVRDVRLYPSMGPPLLEKTLSGPGSTRGIGMRIWNILHGVDNTEVLEARDLPTQISIEDSYGRGHLDNVESVKRELIVLTRSLIRRMRTDLLDKSDSNAPQPRWLAHPRTLRLSTRPRNAPETDGVRTYNANRISRSAPLPGFIFHLDESLDALAERLVQDPLMAMFRRLHSDKSGWDLSLMNVAVTNMVESAGDQKQSNGRDISQMFRQQSVAQRNWTEHGVGDDADSAQPAESVEMERAIGANGQGEGEWEEEEEEDGLASVECPQCSAAVPRYVRLFPVRRTQPTDLISARSQASEAIRQVTPIDNAVIRTPSHQIDHLAHFDLTFELHRDGQRIKLELEPNHDILAEDAYVQYLEADGTFSGGEPIHRHEHKVFQGRALVGSGKGRWTPSGWARVTVRQDGLDPLFEGAFSIGHEKHHIELQSTYLAKKRKIDADIEHRASDYMVVYRDSDMLRMHQGLKRSLSLSAASGCQADKLDYNSDLTNTIFGAQMPGSRWGVSSLNSMFGLSKRQSDVGGVSGSTGGVNLKSAIGDTSGCPKTKKVALIGVATDCEMTNYFSSTNSTPKAAAKDFVINLVNTASSVYESSFNVSIGLRNLTINQPSCPTSSDQATPWNVGCSGGNITWRLNEFSKWRGDNADSNAYWTLMTGCPTDSEVGVSWMGRLCTSDVTTEGSSSVSGTNVVVGNQGTTWQIFAHESGHTFGAVHDCDTETCNEGLEDSSQCCPLTSTTCNANAKYIMNPYAESSMTNFSECTVGNICSAIGRNSINSTCLSDNRGVVTLTGSQCGNGIVESGEDCDCGGTEGCGDNACCDATTCKFKNNAVCDDSNDNCCNKCQYASADTVCRAAVSECDHTEKCTGNSGACPADEFKKDGTSCGDSGKGLTCASGQCTSRDYQCRSIMGTLLNSNDSWACDNTNAPACSVVCGAPQVAEQYGTSTCIEANQNYLDGTPCENGGHCSGGQCQGSSVGGWIREHKNIVIGVCVAVGSLILLSLLFCIVNRCRTASARRRMAKAGAPPMGRFAGPPPPMRGPPPGNQWYGGYPPNPGYNNVPPPRYS